MSEITRREFAGQLARGGAVVAIGGTLMLEGCGVFSSIEAWIPVGEAALNGIVTILEAGGFFNPAAAGIVTTIEAAFTQLLADVKLYQSITPPPAGALAKVMAGLEIIVTNFQAFLSSINVTNSPLLSTIVGLVQVILSTIAAFESQLPASATVGLKVGSSFSLSGRQYGFTPVSRSKRQFVKDFNRVAKAGGYPRAEIAQSFWDKL